MLVALGVVVEGEIRLLFFTEILMIGVLASWVPELEGRAESFLRSNRWDALYAPVFDFLCSRDWSEKRDLMILSAGMGLAATAVAGTPGLRAEDIASVFERVWGCR